MDPFLTPNNDLQEIPLGNADFSWFTNDSYLKEDNDKYCAGYAIGTPFDAVEETHLSMATLTQKFEFSALTQACTWAKGKTANIYTESRYALWVSHDFGMLWKQHGFLIFNKKLKMALMLRNYWMKYFYLSLWLVLRFWGVLNLTHCAIKL